MASTSRELRRHDRDRVPAADQDHRSADDIRRDIDRNRRELDILVEAMEEKLSPRQLADDVWSNLKSRFGDGGTALTDQVREHPMPAALIGAGLAWLAVESSTRGRAVDVEASESGPGAMERLKGVGHRASEAGRRAREKASEWRARAGSGGSRAREGLFENLENNPLAMGTAALGLGLLAGMAAPTTRKEDEWMGETRDEMLERASEAGADMADRGRQVADELARKAEARRSSRGEREHEEYEQHEESPEPRFRPGGRGGGRGY